MFTGKGITLNSSVATLFGETILEKQISYQDISKLNFMASKIIKIEPFFSSNDENRKITMLILTIETDIQNKDDFPKKDPKIPLNPITKIEYEKIGQVMTPRTHQPYYVYFNGKYYSLTSHLDMKHMETGIHGDKYEELKKEILTGLTKEKTADLFVRAVNKGLIKASQNGAFWNFLMVACAKNVIKLEMEQRHVVAIKV